jgi:hypothetical protein
VYDIIFIGARDSDAFAQLKERFPAAKPALTLEEAQKKSFTKLFWLVWPDMNVCPDFKFDYKVPEWDQKYVHVFKNGDHQDGVCLISKTAMPTAREFQYRFFINKKEVDIVASTPKPYEVVFISYFEKDADARFAKLKTKVQQLLLRIDGVKGIHEAHRRAAMLVETDMFWVVDADADVLDSFNFNFSVPRWDSDSVYVWKSKNPVNGLEYGYGGIKLLPTKQTLNMDMSNPDMTTSISKKFNVVNEVSNFTAFNTDPFSAWKSAFRECVKLSSNIIRRQNPEETIQNLSVWCNVGADRPYGEFAIAGALAGKKYGQENAGNIPALSLINDFDWLKIQFEQTLQPLEKSQQ